MKAISLWQPHASLIPLGLKRHETRSWGTNYRGDLLICSAKRNNDDQFYNWIWILQELDAIGALGEPKPDFPMWDDLPFGCAVCVVDLTDCIKMTREFIAHQTEAEKLVGDWEVDRFAWKLDNIRGIDPFPVRGRQGLFDIDVDLKQLEAVT